MPETKYIARTTGVKKVRLDKDLWEQCQLVVPQASVKPWKLPVEVGHLRVKGLGVVDVFMVDGKKIERDHDMDFTQGGNSAEDPGLMKYIRSADKENETRHFVVLDDRHDRHDLCFVCLHEAVELQAMVVEKMDYEDAHEKRANPQELEARRQFA